MSDQEGTTSSFDWVADLPSFTGLIPPQTASIIPRFSLFSLFRFAPGVPQESSLEPLLALAELDCPLERHVIKGLACLEEYLVQLQKILGDGEKGVQGRATEVVEEKVGRLMGAYLVAIKVGAKGFAAGDTVAGTSQTVPQSLRGFFTIYNHLLDSPTPSTLARIQQAEKHILASPHPLTGPHNHFAPLFDSVRSIITSTQHSVRTVVTKGSSNGATSTADIHAMNGKEAVMRMRWLAFYAEHLRGLEGLPKYAVGDNEEDKGEGMKLKKQTQANLKKEEQDRRNRPIRIALEADLLRCDLALSMVTAQIGAVKSRARVINNATVLRQFDDATVVGIGSRVASSGVSSNNNRTKRALTDESDLETVWEEVEKERKPEPRAAGEERKQIRNPDPDAVAWEKEAGTILLEVLGIMKGIMDTRLSAILTERIEREDWLNDGAQSSIPEVANGKSEGREIPTYPKSDGEEDEGTDEEDEPESSESSESVGSEADVSNPCPLRTLFRLHDRYEEQRLAVWLSLPSETRGKMGIYMRGEGGEVGAAWDMLGLGLLMEYDSDSLEAYGLSLDKLDKWVHLASRRNAKKIRKRSRKTF